MRKILFISMMLIMVLTLAACKPKPQATTGVDEAAFGTLVASTLTAVANQAILTEIAIPTATFTEMPAATATLTLTPTEEMVLLSVTEQANCRKGPGTYYPVLSYIQPGGEVMVLGKNAAGDWYFVQVPTETAGGCWISSSIIAGLSGNTEILRVLTAQPTTVPTKAPTVKTAGSFSFAYVGYDTCNGGVAPKFSITNTSMEIIQAIKVRTTITDVDPKLEGIFRSDTFGGNLDLVKGEGATFVACDDDSHFSIAIEGHSMHSEVTVCTENGMDGDCVTAVITFKP